MSNPGPPPDDGNQEPDRRSLGRPGYHDPTAGIGGEPPARSALTLRLLLAGFGLLLGAGGGFWAVHIDAPGWLVAALIAIAVVAIINLIVVALRKRGGEPG